MKTPLFLFFLLFISNGSLAQSKAANSSQVLIDSLNELAFKVKRYDVAKAFSLLTQSENNAYQTNYKRGIATSFLYEAGIYQQNGYTKKALAMYYASLNISKSINDTFNIARANQQIAAALKEDGKLKEAEDIYLETLQVYQKMGKQDEVVNIKNNLALVDIDLKEWDEAYSGLTEALELSKKINYRYGEKKANYNLGIFFLAQNTLPTARTFFTKALLDDEDGNDKYGLSLSQLKLAEIDFKEKKFEDCIAHATAAYYNAKLVAASQLMADAATQIIKTYRATGNSLKVDEWQRILIANIQQQNEKEKEYAINFIDILKAQETETFTAQKNATAAQQTSKEQLVLIAISTIALFGVGMFAIIAYRNYKKQQVLANQLKEKQLTIQQKSNEVGTLNKAISLQNQQLDEENKMKDKLLSIISHDLRHPLVNTKSILELISMKLVSAAETDDLLDQLEGQYVRSLTLLDNLLFWIRGQMMGKDFEKIRLNMKMLIDGLVDEQRMPFLAKEINVSINIEDEIEIVGDKEMLKIIFRNLIANAIKFTPDQGAITISSRTDNSWVYILIKDTGLGMSKETLQKVNAGQYYSSKGTSNETGSGFGLILCRDLVAKNNGELIIESEVGKGSVLMVKLPKTY